MKTKQIKRKFITKEEEIELINRYRGGDEEALASIVCNFEGLVVSEAKKHFHITGMGMTVDDLIQEGYVGLIKGINNFKIEKNVRLMTYAPYYIRKEIKRSIIEKGRLVCIPENVQY